MHEGIMAAKALKKVLTVDDDSSIRLLIRSALSGNKAISVLEAVDGVDGLEAVRKYHPDLVILDVAMPRKTGIEVLTVLRSDPSISGIPVILLTGIKDNSQLLPLLEQECTDYIAKPFVIEKLRKKVNDYLFPKSASC